MGLISRVSSRTYRKYKMIKEKLSIFDKKVENDSIFLNVSVDRFEDATTSTGALEKTENIQNPGNPEQTSKDEQFSSASSGSESDHEEPEQIILCTKCNIA